MIAGGTITIRDGETVLFSGPYSQVTPLIVTYRFPTAGTHTLTLDYSGDVNFNPASATLTQLVTKAIATVQLLGNPASPLSPARLSDCRPSFRPTSIRPAP